MVKLVCKLTFSDGQEAAGMVDAAASGVNYPIIYSGAANRLAMQYAEGTPSDLELIFTVTAHRTGAKLTVERTGQYESRTG